MKSVTSYKEFEQLDVDEKAFHLSDHGILLQSIKRDNICLSLHYFPRFYVEVIIDITERKILEITAFKNSDRLEKYLEEIDLRV